MTGTAKKIILIILRDCSSRKKTLVADTGNNGSCIWIKQPSGEDYANQNPICLREISFKPVRIVVDKAQRIYVMATGVFDGFMEFSADGTFSSFIGANRVQLDPADYFGNGFDQGAEEPDGDVHSNGIYQSGYG